MKFIKRFRLFLVILFIDSALFGVLLCSMVGLGESTAADAPGVPDYERNQNIAEQKLIALTFDDGPHPVYTKQLLEGLKIRGVHATFFLIGESIEGNEELVRQMYEEGHLIGNHSNTHTQLNKASAEKACKEIEETNKKIYNITGQQPSYIRPPFGSWSDELECLVPMTVVLWDVDPLDWKVQNSKKVTRHILRNAEENSIILLHDVYGTSVQSALEVIDTLTKQGYTFVTVDELLID